jgi:SAM-dependent methyltransferase
VVSRDRLAAAAAAYYSARFAEHGATARGVDWNGEAAQALRFDQLLRVVDRPGLFSLLDYGCGYGALLTHLRAAGSDCDYTGFDLSEPMIDHARGAFAADPAAHFSSDEAELRAADYVVASGVFNVRQDASAETWSAYVLESLDRLDALGRHGFAVNLLTSYSDPERMREDLWYADPGKIFDHCRRSYSRNIALLHDYGLYEFTVVVRKP